MTTIKRQLKFGAIHPVAQQRDPDAPFVTPIEPRSSRIFLAQPMGLFQPAELRLLSSTDAPLRVTRAFVADPESPDGECYRTVTIDRNGPVVSLEALKDHVVGIAECFALEVVNDSAAVALVEPVLIAKDVAYGSNIMAMQVGMPTPRKQRREIIRGSTGLSWVNVTERAPFMCRPRKLTVRSDSEFDVKLCEIKFGNRSQFINCDQIAVELFKDGFDLGAKMECASAWQDIAVCFRNLGPHDRWVEVEFEVEAYKHATSIPAAPIDLGATYSPAG